MAFEQTTTRTEALLKASNVLGKLKTARVLSQELAVLVANYQLGTDATLVAAFNAMFSPAERLALATMIGDLDALTVVWATTYPAVFGGD